MHRPALFLAFVALLLAISGGCANLNNGDCCQPPASMPGRRDRWGISAKASERMEAAGLKIRFTDDGYRLDEWR